MIRTGLPLLEALNILSESSDDKTLKAVFKQASIGISRGATLQEILEKHPDVFDDMYLALSISRRNGRTFTRSFR